MSREIFSYEPLKPVIDASRETTGGGVYPFSPPSLEATRSLYEKTGFPNTPQGEKAKTVALRGSTAALLPENGALIFRHRRSDVDMLSVTGNANAIGAGYLIYHIHLPKERLPREIDVLFFTPDRLAREKSSEHRSFLTTKLIQPGWPIIKPEEYDRYKTDAMATLILRGIARRDLHRITPSGAARLVLEEDLYAEPWRWTSMKTYFVESPERERQKRQLLHYANTALINLVNDNVAERIHIEGDTEPVYEIGNLDKFTFRHPRLDRILTSFNFVCDQLSLLLYSRQGLSSENVVRVLMKWRSLVMNPTLSYNADIIFRPKGEE